MRQIGYSLVDSDGNEIASTQRLPWSPPPPGKPKGRLATFEAVGQTVDGLTVVERWETEPAHGYQVKGNGIVSKQGAHVVVDHKWTDKPFADVVAERVAEIKRDAQDRIISLVGATDLTGCLVKQLNANMRANELNDRQVNGGLSASDQAEAAALRNLAAAIRAIRNHSNALEAEVAALGTVAQVVAWKATGWPT